MKQKVKLARYDKILLAEYAKLTARKSSKLQVKNLPNLFWAKNTPNCRNSVEQQYVFN